MRKVGIKVLKQKLSEYLRLASAGETILITDRGRAVAELIAPTRARADRIPHPLLADAVRRGLMTSASLPPGPPPASPGVAPLDEILHGVDRDRADR